MDGVNGTSGRDAMNAPERYASRRRRAFEAMEPDSLLLLFSGEAVPSSMDACHPFEANHHFFYLTGLRRERMALAIRKTDGTLRETLFIEEPMPESERWTGRRMRKEEAAAESGVGDVRWIADLDAFVSRCGAREPVRNAYFDCYRDQFGAQETFNAGMARRFRDEYPAVRLMDAHPLIAKLRMRKDGDETEKIREAVRLTDAGLRRVLATLRPGFREYEMQAEFEYAVRKGGAEGLAFPTIAGSGANGCMLHYEENDAWMGDGDLLLLDLGARFRGYCADVSRTYPVGGRYTERQLQFYNLVLKANRAVAAFAGPGKTLKELNDLCREVLAEGMTALGKIEKPEDIGTYYMHSVSHHLGIDTHDATAPDCLLLEPGRVITDEPGLYVDEEGIGIRIEDDLLITEDGCVVLSEAIPRDPEEIERIMAGGAGG